jgi:anti-sigma B factor antagonist
MSAPHLQVQHEQIDPVVVVITLSGKLMLGREGEQLVDLVADLLGKGTRGIIFNIGDLTRVDSTGIGRFIASYNRIAAAGGEMAIAAATPHLRECFHTTQLDRVFRFYDDVPAARAALAPVQKKEA